MDALHFTTIIYFPGKDLYHTVYCWSLDGRLQYLEGGHIPVFVVGLLFAVASLPFMLTLLCIQHIGRFSNWPFCSWIHKLKPFFDTFTGPLTDRGRFWVGLLLFARLFILSAYSFNEGNSIIIVMGITVLVCFILLFVAIVLPEGIYKSHTLNVLEYFFLINTGVLFLLSICGLYYGKALARAYMTATSAAISFVIFVIVLAHHILTRLGFKNYVLRCWMRLLPLRFCKTENSAMANFGGEDDPLLRDVAREN